MPTPDISIGEVNTTMEINGGAGSGSADVRKLLALLTAQLRAEEERNAMRRQDGDLRDRAWLSDVKAE